MREEIVKDELQELRESLDAVENGSADEDQVVFVKENIIVPFNLSQYNKDDVKKYFRVFKAEVDSRLQDYDSDKDNFKEDMERNYLNRLFRLKERETLYKIMEVGLMTHDIFKLLVQKHVEGFGGDAESIKDLVTSKAEHDADYYILNLLERFIPRDSSRVGLGD